MPTKTRAVDMISWMYKRHVPEVLAIEADVFAFPWSEAQLIQYLRNRNCIGIVAERDERVVGYAVYQVDVDRIEILNLASIRKGVGTMLVDKLKSKLSGTKRNRIICRVRESNVDAQLFFKAMGFRCVRVLHGSYEGSDEDAYCFRYRIK